MDKWIRIDSSSEGFKLDITEVMACPGGMLVRTILQMPEKLEIALTYVPCEAHIFKAFLKVHGIEIVEPTYVSNEG